MYLPALVSEFSCVLGSLTWLFCFCRCYGHKVADIEQKPISVQGDARGLMKTPRRYHVDAMHGRKCVLVVCLLECVIGV